MPTVLILDDSRKDTSFNSFICKVGGYNCIVVHDGQVALNVLTAPDAPTAYFVVLLDIAMPGMDGVQFLEIASADERLWSRIRCMVISAGGLATDAVSHIAAATDTPIPFLQKPFDPEEFLELLGTLVATLPSTS